MVLGALVKAAAKGAAKGSKKKKGKGRSYTLKNTTKARVKIGVVGSRAQLAYKDLAKAAASGENTKIQRGIRQAAAGTQTDGSALKEGMIAMADRIGVSQEQYEQIANLDENILASMYDSNDITFEVFFNYEGIQKMGEGKPYLVTDEKRNDVTWFLEQYEKVKAASEKAVYGDVLRYANDVI